MGELFTAIKTQVLISPEQGFVAQRRDVVFCKQVFVRVLAEGRDNGVNADDTLATADGVDAAVDLIKCFSQGVTDLVKCD